MGYFLAYAAGCLTVYFWPSIKTKLSAWYDAMVAKI